jgi:hypothetical protein
MATAKAQHPLETTWSTCTARTEDDAGAASYEAEAEVRTDGLACGLVSHRPQTPKPKPKDRKLTGAQRKKAMKAK